jgi:signal transduction histidine kinase
LDLETSGQIPRGDLASLIGEISEGIMLIRRGVVAWASGRAGDLLGREEAGDVVGETVEALFFDLGSGTPVWAAPEEIVECGVRGLEGAERRLSIRRLRSDLRPGPAELWLLRDRSRSARQDELVFELSRDLQRANRELIGLRQRSSRMAGEREELLNVVSHELRTPVTVIAGYNRLLLSGQVGELSEEQRRFLGESAKSCRRLNAFIGNLLEASREGAVESSLDPGIDSLEQAIRDVAGFLRPLLAERGLDIELELDGGADKASFDRVRIEQVLTNLISNAIRYSEPGDSIGISTAGVRLGGRGFVEVSVVDHGPGVAQTDRERIFEPYVRASGESEAGGLGLGLAICKRIVEAHNGSIRVTEEPDGGSRFSFVLPAAQELQEAS